jgi:hypothetical protein
MSTPKLPPLPLDARFAEWLAGAECDLAEIKKLWPLVQEHRRRGRDNPFGDPERGDRLAMLQVLDVLARLHRSRIHLHERLCEEAQELLRDCTVCAEGRHAEHESPDLPGHRLCHACAVSWSAWHARHPKARGADWVVKRRARLDAKREAA